MITYWLTIDGELQEMSPFATLECLREFAAHHSMMVTETLPGAVGFIRNSNGTPIGSWLAAPVARETKA